MDIFGVHITQNAQDSAKLGENVAAYLVRQPAGEAPHVICLYGELGSGKTTFVQGFARGLGITSRLLSPTFIIVRRYEPPRRFSFLYHLDLYRLASKSDTEGLGLPEIFADQSSLVLIEWAEKLGDLLPEKRIDIHFDTMDNGDHRIKVDKI